MIPHVRIRANSRHVPSLMWDRADSLSARLMKKDRPFLEREHLRDTRASIARTNSGTIGSTNSPISAAGTMNDVPPFKDMRGASERIVYSPDSFPRAEI